jgi:hypothetical protein
MITEKVATPMGDMVDTTWNEKGSLLFSKRKIQQGPSKIDLAYADKKVTGKMVMNGQEHPVTADLGGPMFAEGAGAGQVVALLPLEAGYKTVVRNMEQQRSKEQLMQLEVTGSETVKVPAGEFETWKVEMTPADGGAGKATLWIGKSNRRMVKLSAVIPEMGGAKMTMELE